MAYRNKFYGAFGKRHDCKIVPSFFSIPAAYGFEALEMGQYVPVPEENAMMDFGLILRIGL